MSGLAAVQSRILEIQSRFPAPVVTSAVAAGQARTGGASSASAAPAGGTAFAKALADATTASSSTRSALSSAPLPPSSGGVSGEQVVAKAKEMLGTPYVWGGESLAEGGFDCSGLLQWAYGSFGVDLPRVSRDQAKVGREVSPAEARPGDLVFFDRPTIDHIGMYAGNGEWVVAPKTGDVVKMQKVDLSQATTIRRVLPDAPAAVAGSPAGVTAKSATPYAATFAAAGAEHGVSPALLTAVARAESGFDPKARSSAGAQGLMQFMPATARGLGIDPWQPEQAIDGAARLLKQHLTRFGSPELALAAYNAGPGAVTKHGGVPPYPETQNYVRKIMSELRAETA